jgi:hypothetical protein
MREDFLQDNRLFVEQRKTQVMLNTLMPRHVSAALVDPKARGQSIVHFEGSVSILFCDIYNFSDLVATVCNLPHLTILYVTITVSATLDA